MSSTPRWLGWLGTLAGIVSIMVLVPDIREHAMIVLGIFSATLAVNVIWVAVKSEKAQRREDYSMIMDVQFVARQCEHALEMLGRTAGTHDGSTYRALDQLATRISLCITRYRRYLNPATIESLKGVEMVIMKAQINRDTRMTLTIFPINKAIMGIKYGIREIDDADLQAARRRI